MNFSLETILSLTNGKLIQGASEGVIKGLASLSEAGPEDLSFLGNKKYVPDFEKTQAKAVLVPQDFPLLGGDVVLIEVENPSLAFSLVLENSLPPRIFRAGIAPSACVSSEAEVDGVMIREGAVIAAGVSVGKGTEIGPGVVLEEGVRIGENCLLYANVVVREHCILGNRVVLHPGVVIGSDGYGYELVEGQHRPIPQVGIVELEDDVDVGANSTIDRARFGKTLIRKGTKIDNLVQVGHNVKIGQHCLIIAQAGIAGSSQLGNYVTLAAKVGVSGHLTLDDGVILGACAAATKSLKKNAYWGVPAIPLKESKKQIANVSRLPILKNRVTALEEKLVELEAKLAQSEME